MGKETQGTGKATALKVFAVFLTGIAMTVGFYVVPFVLFYFALDLATSLEKGWVIGLSGAATVSTTTVLDMLSDRKNVIKKRKALEDWDRRRSAQEDTG